MKYHIQVYCGYLSVPEYCQCGSEKIIVMIDSLKLGYFKLQTDVEWSQAALLQLVGSYCHNSNNFMALSLDPIQPS